MSILIKGMKMPKDCVSCPMFDGSGDYPGCDITGLSRGYNWNPFGQRMPDCPLVEVPKWIPVSERLPEDYELVLTCDDRQNIHIMSHTNKYKYPFGISPDHPRYFMVKYWMPLPEPPKEET